MLIDHIIIKCVVWIKTVDPEKARLQDDLKVSQVKEKRSDFIIANVKNLAQRAGNAPITAATLNSLVNAKDDKEVETILKQYPETRPNSAEHHDQAAAGGAKATHTTEVKNGKAKSHACIIS
jgi:hypothetical protein